MTTFDIIMIGMGALLLLIAVCCAVAGSRGEDRVIAMRDTPTYTAQEIQQIHRHAGGGFGQPCEISGVVEGDWSLTGPLSGQPCAAYSHVIAWEHWGPSPYAQRNGNTELIYRDGGTELDDRHVPTFWVRDATGRIMVDPINAELDLLEIDERYDVMTASVGGGERRSTRTEKALPFGHQVYVLGYLGQRDGEPALMRHPSDPSKKFLISYRNEQELARANRGSSYLYYFAAGSSGAVGALLVLWRLLLHHV